ncbi:hypothetical protein O6P43_012905 [Quillaja saponaria]|uniref:Uncharacterized protein n=1 Tax=Quillaja saponaria TaxID=32244 RepID=A0AAD7M399_QUISA|nr:hypothetical protein O6P43_012905 [Quillaja saponaria]
MCHSQSWRPGRVPPLVAAHGGACMIRQVSGLDGTTREVVIFNSGGRPSSQVAGIGLQMDWKGSSQCTKSSNLEECSLLWPRVVVRA